MLERLQLAPLRVGQAHGAGNRHDDALVVGHLGSVRQRRREGGQRHAAWACAVGDHRCIRNALALYRVGPILVGDAGVADAGVRDARQVGKVRVGSVGDEQDPHPDPLGGSRGRRNRRTRPASGKAKECHEAAQDYENSKQTSHIKLGFKLRTTQNHQHQARGHKRQMPVTDPRTGSTRAAVCLLPRPVRMGSLAPLAFTRERAQRGTSRTRPGTESRRHRSRRPSAGRGDRAIPVRTGPRSHGRRAAAGLLHC